MRKWLLMRTFPLFMADDGGGAGGGTGSGGGDGGGGAAAFDWSAPTLGLDQGAKDLVTTKGWKSPVDVFKGYSELERLVGQDKVALPGKDADGTAWDGVWNKLGRPDSHDKYTIPPRANGTPYGEGDVAFQKQLLPALHKAGLTQRQVEALVPAWNDLQARGEQAQAQQQTARITAVKDELTREWGGEDGFKKNMNLANGALKTLAGDRVGEFQQLKLSDGTMLGDNPILARMFAKLGAQMAEDGSLVGGNEGGGFGGSGMEAKAELDAIYKAAASDPKHAYNDEKHPEHQAMRDKAWRLTMRVAEG